MKENGSVFVKLSELSRTKEKNPSMLVFIWNGLFQLSMVLIF